jgi:pyrroloquinoline quinone biosynthesis protein B
VRLRLLGSAAGGAFPQWNCACSGCRLAREDSSRAWPRTQCSLAFTGSGDEWYLIGAGPDVRRQIEDFPALHPGPGPRETRIRGVLLTDAELDHTIGLLIVREGSPLDVYGTEAVLAALQEAFPIRRLTRRYASVRWTAVAPGRPLALERGRLEVSTVPLGRKRPRYAAEQEIDGDWVVGYRIADLETGGTAVFAPGVERWSRELEALLAGAGCAFVDGTFWSDDEMARRGTGQATATAMGHLPIGGEGGSAERLAGAGALRTVYVHLNNTNPVLDERSPERGKLRALGIEVGWDGMEVEL